MQIRAIIIEKNLPNKLMKSNLVIAFIILCSRFELKATCIILHPTLIAPFLTAPASPKGFGRGDRGKGHSHLRFYVFLSSTNSVAQVPILDPPPELGPGVIPPELPRVIGIAVKQAQGLAEGTLLLPDIRKGTVGPALRSVPKGVLRKIANQVIVLKVRHLTQAQHLTSHPPSPVEGEILNRLLNEPFAALFPQFPDKGRPEMIIQEGEEMRQPGRLPGDVLVRNRFLPPHVTPYFNIFTKLGKLPREG